MWVKIVVSSRLVPMVFLRVLRIPSSTKTSMCKLQFDLGTRMKTAYPRMKTSSSYVRGNSENFKWRFTPSLSFCRFPGLFHIARSLFLPEKELWNHSRTAACLANWMNRVVFFVVVQGYFLLHRLASMVGLDEFDEFLFNYVQHFKGQLVASEVSRFSWFIP